MGRKIVRDGNERWCREHGVSGEWRTCETPVASLTKKLFEEAAEFAEDYDPAELYDLRDVVNELIDLTDRDQAAARAHVVKVGQMGMFTHHVEWCPVPPEQQFPPRMSDGHPAYPE